MSSFPPERFSPAAIQGASGNQKFALSNEKIVMNVCKDYSRFYGNYLKERDSFIIHFPNIPSYLQDGPSCGLVALRMTGEYFSALRGEEDDDYKTSEPCCCLDSSSLGTSIHAQCRSSTSDLLSLCQSLRYTNHGEMFSAYELAHAAAIYYYDVMDVRVVRLPQLAVRDISDDFDSDSMPHFMKGSNVKNLSHADVFQLLLHHLHNHLFLVPYDASPNHEPCNAKGTRCHWALLKGVIVPVDSEHCHPPSIQNICFVERNNFHKLNACSFVDDVEGSANLQLNGSVTFSCNEVYVVAQQGKSKRQMVWPYEKLLISNAQLMEPNKSKKSLVRDMEVSSTEPLYRIPESLDNLRGLAVLVSMKI